MEMRDEELVSFTGWTKAELDEQPGPWLDWMLQLHHVRERHRQAELADLIAGAVAKALGGGSG